MSHQEHHQIDHPSRVHPQFLSYPMAPASSPMGSDQPPPYPQQPELSQEGNNLPQERYYSKSEFSPTIDPGIVNPGLYPPPQYPGPPVEGKENNTPPIGLQTIANEEESQFRNFDFTEQSIRKAFVRKVYAILMCQLLVTGAIMTFFSFHKPTKVWCLRHIWVMGLAVLTAMVCIISMACFEDVRRKSPTNFIFLAVFTLAKSFTLGVFSTVFKGNEVLIAMGVTAAICLALTLFAMQTKWDFTMMGGGLICALMVLIIFGGVAAFTYRDMQLRLWVAALGVFLFSLYLIYDTQLMLGGHHKYTVSPEEYIFAALNLYLDIISIFIRILLLLGRR